MAGFGFDRADMIWIPVRGKPKARPIVTGNNTYMPHDYTSFKEFVGEFMYARGMIPETPLTGALSLEAVFSTDDLWFQMRPIFRHKRVKHVRADIDNLLGGLMDALENANVIVNDKQIVETHVWIDRKFQ